MMNVLILCVCILIIAVAYHMFKDRKTTIVTEISFIDVTSGVRIKTIYVNLPHKEYLDHIIKLKSQQEAKIISCAEIIDYLK